MNGERCVRTLHATQRQVNRVHSREYVHGLDCAVVRERERERATITNQVYSPPVRAYGGLARAINMSARLIHRPDITSHSPFDDDVDVDEPPRSRTKGT